MDTTEGYLKVLVDSRVMVRMETWQITTHVFGDLKWDQNYSEFFVSSEGGYTRFRAKHVGVIIHEKNEIHIYVTHQQQDECEVFEGETPFCILKMED